ncbi:type II toxin-antitoxin system PrlF family antitoxin [Lentilactobacillus buchneri]|uniref:type II toxin-antitoxin system PrlF family antitoxin n=1 Tax=Lentilactobacillus buchneri TaxID=1581 RepID=UPI0002076010|nr:type II toxin-antitoxin system PrlF family antitoxin [Lentilactobacillus buchneri]WCJ52605.1 type II toxin-antitoxin system PrlF family antitoxin [Lentilactobacillus sp. Egmn17]AEB72545.1 transcriptional regulator, AbrB family [Lentilactobacillus buchneri NRRL B-30929]MCT2881371.1 AbrB/MazE/SpoVT family DNA-binding domain-containing protein [Lentilactobacillus buchneri]MCT3253666.1 AbrB/MazE/SpoVT family DNA-binding domain-containing protein [Lentilactobacillus buchneri]MCT3548375.1 AbrB/Ma
MAKHDHNIAVISKITAKNQVTIPKTIREALNVKSSDKIEWELGADGQITVKRTAPEKDDFWKMVDEQEKKYGSIVTPEVDWGEDAGSEDFD